ncbi:MAG: type II toxin-antitoxin system VapC family toxin [Proteobacteria bacterium]|nr:type II toxin-antitoxin system VapC family toxin [Pseudomonadota bacterium]
MSSILLDSNLLYWSFYESRFIPDTIKAEIVDADYRIVSIVSLWELGIKTAAGKLKFDLKDFIEKIDFFEMQILQVDASHIQRIMSLPRHHHRDPFDRMLVAQALAEGLMLYTADKELAAYGQHVKVIERQ